MFNALTALGWGVVTFAITIGVGVVVLDKFGNAVGGDANVSVQYLNDQLGSTSGLASWSPAIIAFAVGMLFLGAFMVKRGGNRSY